MAKSKKSLEEAAKKLMQQARELEKKENEKIGKVIRQHFDEGFEKFNLETLKDECRKTFV